MKFHPYGNLATRLRNTILKALEKVLEGLLKKGGKRVL